MIDTFSFGEWVSQRRKMLDMTQRALAAQTNCALATMKKIESDERRPSRELADALADALQIPPNWRDTFIECARGLRPVDALANMGVKANDSIPQVPVSNLPAQSTPFIGREAELTEIERDLSDPACRLLTLVGPGGIGKTRLAYQAAARQTANFSSGAHAVPLAGINTPDFLLPAIAERLKLGFYGGDPKAQLLNYLHEKQLLLVLDNFEHLLDGASSLAEILESAPGVKILATSRERLNLSGEWLFPVGGLPYPIEDNPHEAEAFNAVQLFEGSARRALPSYTLAADLPAVIHICKLAEGMPLAIELAASWVRRMPTAQIAEQIQRDLDFLSAGWRDAPERHRSIRALFEHSWRLLSPDEEQVMMKLSVFRGGFNADSAKQVAGASLMLLSSLEDKSLVRAHPSGRYDLHELVRQYAENRLREAGLEAEMRSRHLDAFTAWAEIADSKLHGGEQRIWVRQIQVEYDNLRTALEWAFNGGDVESGLRLAIALWFYWFTRGHFLEGYDWMQAGLQQSSGVTPTRAIAFGFAGILAAQLQGGQAAYEYVMQGRQMTEQLGMKEWFAMSNTSLQFGISDYDSVKTMFEDTLAVLRETGNHYFLSTALFLYGDRARGHGDLERAEALYRESLELARADQNQWAMTSPLGNLGRLAVYRGDYERGQALLREAVGINYELDNPTGAADYLIHLGVLAVYRGDHHAAERDLNETLAIWQNLGHEMGIIHVLYCMAELALHREDFVGAARLLADSLNTTLQIPDWQLNFSNREFNIERLVIAGKLACALGDYPQAARLLAAGEALRARVGYVLEPLPRAEFEQAVNETRAQMGDAVFASAWAGGQALNEADAIQETFAYVNRMNHDG